MAQTGRIHEIATNEIPKGASGRPGTLDDSPYRWDIIEAPLAAVANQEKLLPAAFIGADGFGVTDAALRYLAPLIAGEAYPLFKNGLPDYVRLQNVAAPKN
jgi:6-phosphofructokinase 1